MRASELTGLTSLPLEQLGVHLGDGDIVTVLLANVSRSD
jgi:hypothetical protein